MWSGFSSEIETTEPPVCSIVLSLSHVERLLIRDLNTFMPCCSTWLSTVACGAASHLRLKLLQRLHCSYGGRGRMWSGFSSEIETLSGAALPLPGGTPSHVERLLI